MFWYCYVSRIRSTESLNVEFVCNVLVVADQLLITRLKEMCEVVITENCKFIFSLFFQPVLADKLRLINSLSDGFEERRKHFIDILASFDASNILNMSSLTLLSGLFHSKSEERSRTAGICHHVQR